MDPRCFLFGETKCRCPPPRYGGACYGARLPDPGEIMLWDLGHALDRISGDIVGTGDFRIHLADLRQLLDSFRQKS